MHNLNDLSKEGQTQQVPKMQKMQTLEPIPNQESAEEQAPSRLNRFMGITWIFVIVLFFAILGYMIIRDNTKTKKQIQINVDAVMNTPKMQEYRAMEARRQRALAQQRRLRQLGIDGITKPTQKNDLLNQQLKKQEAAEEEEKIENQKLQGVDYTSELAAYRERLKEVQTEETRVRRTQTQNAASQGKQSATQGKSTSAQEQEKAAKAKTAQEKAAYAAKLKAQIEARKTQKNTLQTRN